MTRSIAIAAVVALSAAAADAGLLSVPKAYTPEKSWPVVISYQDNPSPELMKQTKYFLVHAGGKGTESRRKTIDYLKNLAKRYNIDPLRIYGTGFSRGGHEVLTLAWQHPHWYAAIAPVCNDLRSEPKVLNVKYLTATPTLLLHGNRDSFRNTGRRVYELMTAAGCKATYTTYPGGHSPQMPFKKNVKLLTDFFDKHKLDPYPKTVVHVVEHKRYTRAFWVNAALTEDKGGLKEVFTVKVEKGNRIAVEVTDKIAALDLHLTGKLVDMAKPVKVVWKGKTLYEGPAKAPLTVTFRPADKKIQGKDKPLWEEIEAVRATAKYAKPKPSRPAIAPAKKTKGD